MNILRVPTDVGVIIGRFQVDELHPGHISLIDQVVDTHARVIMFLGTSPIKCTINNPLDFETRAMMIHEKYPDIIILALSDMQSDSLWSSKLDEVIKDIAGPHQSVTLYGGRDSFINYYSGKFQCIEIGEEAIFSGSSIRRYVANRVKSSAEFRQGVIWCTQNQYINATPCVDVAIFNPEYTKILLARKQYESKWRFIGGHVDVGETFEMAAVREVREETGIEISELRYVASVAVDDWRHKKEESGITTAVFKCIAVSDSGYLTPLDDICELRWFSCIGTQSFANTIIDTHKEIAIELGFNLG